MFFVTTPADELHDCESLLTRLPQSPDTPPAYQTPLDSAPSVEAQLWHARGRLVWHIPAAIRAALLEPLPSDLATDVHVRRQHRRAHLIEAVIDEARAFEAGLDRSDSVDFWVDDSARCPLCGDGSSAPHQDGFLWPDGLDRHLSGSYNARECPVMRQLRAVEPEHIPAALRRTVLRDAAMLPPATLADAAYLMTPGWQEGVTALTSGATPLSAGDEDPASPHALWAWEHALARHRDLMAPSVALAWDTVAAARPFPPLYAPGSPGAMAWAWLSGQVEAMPRPWPAYAGSTPGDRGNAPFLNWLIRRAVPAALRAIDEAPLIGRLEMAHGFCSRGEAAEMTAHLHDLMDRLAPALAAATAPHAATLLWLGDAAQWETRGVRALLDWAPLRTRLDACLRTTTWPTSHRRHWQPAIHAAMDLVGACVLIKSLRDAPTRLLPHPSAHALVTMAARLRATRAPQAVSQATTPAVRPRNSRDAAPPRPATLLADAFAVCATTRQSRRTLRRAGTEAARRVAEIDTTPVDWHCPTTAARQMRRWRDTLRATVLSTLTAAAHGQFPTGAVRSKPRGTWTKQTLTLRWRSAPTTPEAAELTLQVPRTASLAALRAAQLQHGTTQAFWEKQRRDVAAERAVLQTFTRWQRERLLAAAPPERHPSPLAHGTLLLARPIASAGGWSRYEALWLEGRHRGRWRETPALYTVTLEVIDGVVMTLQHESAIPSAWRSTGETWTRDWPSPLAKTAPLATFTPSAAAVHLAVWLRDTHTLSRDALRPAEPDGHSAGRPHRAVLRDGTVVENRTERFAHTVAAATAFAREHGHLRPSKRPFIGGVDMYQWLKRQVQQYGAGRLSAERRAQVESIPGWRTRCKEDGVAGWGKGTGGPAMRNGMIVPRVGATAPTASPYPAASSRHLEPA